MKRDKNVKNNSFTAVLWGIFTAMVISITVFMITAGIMTFAGGFEEKTVFITVYITCLAAVLAGSFETAVKTGERGLINGIMVAFCYVIFMVMIGYIILPDHTLGLKTLITLAMSVTGGAAGGILGVNMKK